MTINDYPKNSYNKRVARTNEITLLCDEFGIKYENINMTGLRIYYKENKFVWFKCLMKDLDDAEEYVLKLIYGRQSTLDEFRR